MSIFGTTGSDFEGGALGFSRSWSRITSTRSGRPATSGLALSRPSMIRAPDAPPRDLPPAEAVNVRVIPIESRRLVRRDAEAIFERRVAGLYGGLQYIVLMTHRRHGQAVKMQVRRQRRSSHRWCTDPVSSWVLLYTLVRWPMVLYPRAGLGRAADPSNRSSDEGLVNPRDASARLALAYHPEAGSSIVKTRPPLDGCESPGRVSRHHSGFADPQVLVRHCLGAVVGID